MMSQTTAIRQVTAIAALLLGLATAPACADLIVTVRDASASPGGVGNFDVIIQNTGSSDVNIGGFQIELSVDAGSGILFTDATRATSATYIFATHPGDALNAAGNFSNLDFIASDTSFDSPNFYTTLASGAIFGLEHVTFSVDPSASLDPGTIPVSIIVANTQFIDENQNLLNFTPNNGTISLSRSVPEPSSLLLAGLGICLSVGFCPRLSKNAPVGHS